MLHASFTRAQRGERQIIFVSGEAGIGKTTLVDRLLNQVQASGPVQIGRGQCLEQHGSGEAWSLAEQGITGAQELEHPFSLVSVLAYAGWVRQFRGELAQAQALTPTLVTLERKHGFARDVTRGTIEQGRVLMQRGAVIEGVKLFTEGLTQYRATGSRILLPYFLSFLADAYKQQGQVEEGLKVIAEAVQLTETNFDRFWAAEVYRIKGELTLVQSSVQRLGSSVKKSSKLKVQSSKSKNIDPRSSIPDAQVEAEAFFVKAIEIARQQEAKSLELRAVMSIAR